MTTVLFSYAYPPFRFPRAIQVGRLVKFSRLPLRVITCDDGSPRDDSLEAVTRADVDRRVYPDPAGRLTQFWRKLTQIPDRQRPWALRAARAAVAEGLVGRDDVLVTFGQPMSDHLAGLHIREATGCRWIAHFSDPWVDNPFHLSLPLQRQIQARMEARVAATADRLVFTSPETVDLIMAKYPATWRARASALPHAFDPDLYGDGDTAVATSPWVVRYVGAFYRQRNPLALAQMLLRLYRSDPSLLEGVRFELVGQWKGHVDWGGESVGLPPGLLTLRKPVPYLESLRLMRAADLLLILDAPFEQSVFFPSKLVDYIGADRPILAFTPPGTSSRLVAELGGRSYPAGDPRTMLKGLAETLADLKVGRLARPGAEARRAFSGAVVAAEFDALVTNLQGRTSHG